MKKDYSFFILFSFLLISVELFAQRTAPLVREADRAYANLQFKSAVKQYERIVMNESMMKAMRVGMQDTIKMRLADSYWQMRAYGPAAYWYSKLSSSMQSLPAVIRRRAEWEAMNRSYGEAAKAYQHLPGWTERGKGFGRVAIMSRDSADWAVSYLPLDEKGYRAFSPMLLDSVLYWSTNERKSELVPRILGWDGFRYTHILQTKDSFQHFSPLNIQSKWDSSAYVQELKARRLALHFANADNQHLQHVGGPSARSLAAKRGYSALTLPGTTDLKYNVAHTSYSPKTGRIYMNINQSFVFGKDQRRLVTIAEGIWKNGEVKALRSLSLVDSGYMALHPAIHPDGHLLVFSSEKSGGAGGYDLYFSKLQEDSSWATPEPLKELNTAGNELFARFTPTGELVFSSDGWPGYGGLDFYMAHLSGTRTIRQDHLPYPVNSSYDDFGWTQYADGNRGFFSSDRSGDDDIYLFTYHPKWTMINGKLISRKEGSVSKGTSVTLLEIDADGKETAVATTTTDKDGSYSFRTKPNHQYRVEIYLDEIKDRSSPIVAKMDDVMYVNEMAVGKEKEVLVVQEEKVVEPEWVVDADISTTNRSKGAVYKSELNSWMKKADKTFIVHHYFDRVKVVRKDQHILTEVEEALKSNPGYVLYIVSATDCMALDAYNDDLSYRRSVNLDTYFKSKVASTIKRHWVSERNLLIPCDDRVFRVSKQVENRYSYLILIKE